MSENSVLESIYQVLESFRSTSASARINRVVQRRELLDRLTEQDRRLDTLITSFQLKSSIVLRAQPYQAVAMKLSIQTSEIRFHAPSTRLRSKPQVFGRDSEIDDIVRIIQQNSPARIAILGSGGIGKTSLALSVLHDERILQRFRDARSFLSCEAAQSADHIIHDLIMCLQIPPNPYLGNPLDVLLEYLTARTCVEDLLRDLAGIETITLIVTLRGSQRPSSVQWSQLLAPLQPVTLDAAVDIFKAICQKGDEFVVKLVEAVACVPLAVTLLANLAAVEGESTEALWRRWCDESVSMVENGVDRSNNLEISIEISLSSPRIQRDPDALKLLSLLSLLPDMISSEAICTLESGIPGISHVKKGLSTLIQNALITKDASGGIRILSPIRLHMRARHPPSTDARRFLQDHFLDLVSDASSTTLDEPTVQNRFRSEYGNVEAILLDCLDVPLGRNLEDIVEIILESCQHAYLCGILSTHAISLAAAKLASYSSYSAPAKTVSKPRKNFIARLTRFRFLGNASKTISVVQNDQNFGDRIVDRTLKLRGDCLGSCGQILSRQYRFQEAEERFNMAITLHAQAGDVAGHAYDLNNMGCLLSRNSISAVRAETIFGEALALHEEIGDKAGAAYDLVGLGNLLLQRTKPQVAQDMFSRALKLFLEDNDKIGQCIALNGLGHTVLSFSKPSDAARYFLQALELNVEKDDVVGYADSLAGFAYTLLLRSQVLEAKARAEEAISLRSPVEDPDYLHLLGRIHVALYNFETATELFLRAQTLHSQMHDQRGGDEDSRYLLEIDFFQGQLLKGMMSSPDDCTSLLRQRLKEYLFEHSGPSTRSLLCIIDLYTCNVSSGGRQLESLVENNEAKGALELGFYHHHFGCYQLRLGSYKKAEINLQKALTLHTEAENVQGQADDFNKLAETCLRRGLYRDQVTMTEFVSLALKLHMEIGDVAGQGDDIYLQACVYLELGMWDDAEASIQQALELHTKSSMVRGQGLDLATLSSILWQKHLAQVAAVSDTHIAALQALESAAERFARLVATRELSQCQAQYRVMLENNSSITSTSNALLVSVDDW
ncbi:hypothetical protein H0H87_008085 [Tephrocybe sp. NHM501043]|nr:hypothetical protein H0H87_008085 [Tephrocybe sp. NHM501043]